MNLIDFENNGILRKDFLMSNVTSMKTGGNSKWAFFPEDKYQLRDVINFVKKENIKYIVIGSASNLLFPDEGFDGAVVFTEKMKKSYKLAEYDFTNFNFFKEPDCEYFYCESGVNLTSFSYKTLKDGYAGMEFAYGIPASVGGAIYMNAGAYGGEMKSVINSVEYIDEYGEFSIYHNNKEEFSYRHSPFMDSPEKVIVGGIFKLKKADGNTSINEAESNMTKRREKQPLEYPSCGSAFKRPEGYFAGALIEGAGLKGKNIGGAYVSEKHAGFIVNKGDATTNDVIELIKYVQNVVFEKYGVRLEPEIRIIE